MMDGKLPLVSRYNNDFELVEQIGQGAFGDVVKVRNKIDDGIYAVKRIPLRNASAKEKRKVLREVKLLSRLQHDSIVGYYNAWIEGGGAAFSFIIVFLQGCDFCHVHSLMPMGVADDVGGRHGQAADNDDDEYENLKRHGSSFVIDSSEEFEEAGDIGARRQRTKGAGKKSLAALTEDNVQTREDDFSDDDDDDNGEEEEEDEERSAVRGNSPQFRGYALFGGLCRAVSHQDGVLRFDIGPLLYIQMEYCSDRTLRTVGFTFLMRANRDNSRGSPM